MTDNKRLQKIKKSLRHFFRRQWAMLLVCAAFLLVFAILQGYRTHRVRALPDMNGATRFAEEGGYAQISCYFTETENVSPERRAEFAYKIESALTENAITVQGDNESARLFLDCFTVEGQVTLARDRKEVTANAIGTGGDFFYLHPVELISGMYYAAEALSQDQILIDEGLAWQLFGSSNIEGQTVLIGGVPHTIRGVVRTGEGRVREAAGASGQLVYMPASALITHGTLRGGTERMTSYEVIMPDPVRGFAASLIREKLGLTETEMLVIDDNTRFGNAALFKVLRSFGTRSMSNTSVHYSYWENIARGTEDILSIVMVLQMICLAVPVVMIIWEIVYLYRHKQWTAAGVARDIGDRVYEVQARRRQHRLQEGKSK